MNYHLSSAAIYWPNNSNLLSVALNLWYFEVGSLLTPSSFYVILALKEGLINEEYIIAF